MDVYSCMELVGDSWKLICEHCGDALWCDTASVADYTYNNRGERGCYVSSAIRTPEEVTDYAMDKGWSSNDFHQWFCSECTGMAEVYEARMYENED